MLFDVDFFLLLLLLLVWGEIFGGEVGVGVFVCLFVLIILFFLGTAILFESLTASLVDLDQ